MLVLVPATVNGNGLSLNTFEDLVKAPQSGNATKYDYFSDLVKTEHGAKAPQSAQWVLMTKDVIPGSRRQSYVDQQRLVHEKPQYEVPDLLSATVGILAHYVRTGERLFSREPITYTRCRETAGGYTNGCWVLRPGRPQSQRQPLRLRTTLSALRPCGNIRRSTLSAHIEGYKKLKDRLLSVR